MGAAGAVIQLVTRCASADEFVERFARFTSESDVVVPALPHVTVGTAGRFVIRLKDQSEIMAGRCEVTEVKPMAAAPGAAPASARALMRLRLIEMDAHSLGVHMRLIEHRAASTKPPSEPAPAPAPARPPAPGLTPPRRPAAPALTLVRTPPPTPVPPTAAAAAPAPLPPTAAAPAPAPAPKSPPLSPSTIQVMSVPTRPIIRSAPAPTLIGTAPRIAPAASAMPAPTVPAPKAPVASTATAAAAATAFSELESTDVSPVPRPEARVPGAALTLPANPLSDLDAADLGSFIDFQLLETESPEPVSVTEKVRADAPAPKGRPTAVVATRAGDRAERAHMIVRRVGPYAACVAFGLVVGLALRAGPKAAPVAVAAPAVATATVVAPPEAAPPVTPAPARAVAARTAPPRACVARVTTTPPGAAVTWGNVALGVTPLDRASVPCGEARVTFKRERYAEVTKTITAETGKSAMVSERMSRPAAKLHLTSSPPRARIKLNKRPIGSTPRRIGTMRFETIRIDASLPGYQPWTKTLYLREAETDVDVALVPIPKPTAKRAPSPAAAPARGGKPAAAPPPAPPARAR